MGNIFAGQTLTQTGKIGSDTIDPSKMSFGKLGLTGAAITSQSPFVSPFDSIVGSDVKLIHGDRWQEILGQMTEDVGLTAKTTIGKLAVPPLQLPGGAPSAGGTPGGVPDTSPPSGSWIISVAGNEDITVFGNLNQEVFGTTNYTYVDSTNTTNTGTVTADYANQLQVQQPTTSSWWQWESNQGYGLLVQIALIQLQYNTSYVQLVAPLPPIPPFGVLPPVYITLVAGLNLTEDVLNMQKTWALGVTVDAPAKADFKTFWAMLGGAKVKVEGGQIRLGGTVGTPPHPPISGG